MGYLIGLPGQGKKHFKRRRICNAIQRLKVACAECGSFNDLTFHHIDSNEKETNINEIVKGASIIQLINEINKCCILCRRCHTDVHNGYIDNNFVKLNIDYSYFQ